MISHNTLYNLANALGVFAMLTVVAYHFVAVNSRSLQYRPGNGAHH
ncbi:OST4 family protein [Abortiporus biennis]